MLDFKGENCSCSLQLILSVSDGDERSNFFLPFQPKLAKWTDNWGSTKTRSPCFRSLQYKWMARQGAENRFLTTWDGVAACVSLLLSCSPSYQFEGRRICSYSQPLGRSGESGLLLFFHPKLSGDFHSCFLQPQLQFCVGIGKKSFPLPKSYSFICTPKLKCRGGREESAGTPMPPSNLLHLSKGCSKHSRLGDQKNLTFMIPLQHT